MQKRKHELSTKPHLLRFDDLRWEYYLLSIIIFINVKSHTLNEYLDPLYFQALKMSPRSIIVISEA